MTLSFIWIIAERDFKPKADDRNTETDLEWEDEEINTGIQTTNVSLCTCTLFFGYEFTIT